MHNGWVFQATVFLAREGVAHLYQESKRNYRTSSKSEAISILESTRLHFRIGFD